jgi:NitT/TauT family transport system substrate-binding protein
MRRKATVWLIVLVLFCSAFAVNAGAEVKKVTVALGDIASVETLNLLIALENARGRGLDIDLVAFKSEDIANQAIVNNQAHIGIGTPYAVIQNVKSPIRMFFQLAKLNFYCVVNNQYYKSWKDLDGADLAVHSRTSGTLALANMMAQKEGIKYGNISYVPGSEVRALAMLKGNIKATWLDAANKDFLMKKAPGKFTILPMGDVSASDECLFARSDFIQNNPNTMNIIVEELLKVWRRANADPFYIEDERARLKLLPELPQDLVKEINPYFIMAAASGMYPSNGGGAAAAKSDFEFYTFAGQLKGKAADLKLEDYWNLQPLETAMKKLGKIEEIKYDPPE